MHIPGRMPDNPEESGYVLEGNNKTDKGKNILPVEYTFHGSGTTGYQKSFSDTGKTESC